MALRGSSHLEDVSRAFVAATRRAPESMRVCHVTSEEWMTWDHYHRVLAAALSAPEPKLVHIPTDLLARMAPKRAVRCLENYQFNGVYDNSTARIELGYQYTIRFAQGAAETLQWVLETGGFENSDNDPFYDEVLTAWSQAAIRLERELCSVER